VAATTLDGQIFDHKSLHRPGCARIFVRAPVRGGTMA
jgi:hypothetical protein